MSLSEDESESESGEVSGRGSVTEGGIGLEPELDSVGTGLITSGSSNKSSDDDDDERDG